MMTTRWMIAAAGAIGVGVLTASALLGPSTHVRPEGINEESGADPDRGAGGCQADKQANLDFTVKDMNGARVRLDAHKGKVILINFWATWCPPCKVELPGLIALQDAYKDKGLMILGISEDDSPETLRTFAAEWKINYPMLVGLGEEKLFDAFGPLYGLPTSVIVGRDGAVCGRHVGAATKEEFEREIKALL
jgi:thiol-disulfide isomerase/thioredoxin